MIRSIQGAVQAYDWGGDKRIADLLGLPQQRIAELWLGAHPRAPAKLDGTQALDTWLEQDPALHLGQDVANKYGELPFLLKILDIERPLSIQIHPTLEQARRGFAAEEASGVARTDPRRNFRDANHKPELAVALQDTWMLYGFRDQAAMGQELDKLGIARLGEGADSAAELLQNWLQMSTDDRAGWLEFAYAAAEEAKHTGQEEASWWLRRWKNLHSQGRWYDPGILGFALFNLVNVPAGRGVFLAANEPHAYLEGVMVEVMANSDNVLRCGLTTKHIDVDQMMGMVTRTPRVPELLGASEGDVEFLPPVEEFALQRCRQPQNLALKSSSAEIWLCMQGKARIADAASTRDLGPGEAVLITANTDYEVTVHQGADLFRAFVPVAA